MFTPFHLIDFNSKGLYTSKNSQLNRVIDLIEKGSVAWLISPRNYSKKVIINESIAILRKKQPEITVFYIDFFPARSETDFYRLFVKGILETAVEAIPGFLLNGKNFFKKIRPKISITISNKNNVSVHLEESDWSKYKWEIVNLPQKIAAYYNTQLVVCLQELQILLNNKFLTNIFKEIVALWENHTNVSYFLCTTQESLIKNLNNSIYRKDNTVLLQKIPIVELEQYILKKTKKSGRFIKKDTASKLLELMKGYPLYVNLVLEFAFLIGQKEINDEYLDITIKELISIMQDFFKREVEQMSKTQSNLLIAIAKEKNPRLTSTAMMEKYHLGTPRNVIKNKSKLIDEGVLSTINGSTELANPLFEMWLKQTFDF